MLFYRTKAFDVCPLYLFLISIQFLNRCRYLFFSKLYFFCCRRIKPQSPLHIVFQPSQHPHIASCNHFVPIDTIQLHMLCICTPQSIKLLFRNFSFPVVRPVIYNLQKFLIWFIYPAASQSIINGAFSFHNTFLGSRSRWLITNVFASASCASHTA